MNEQSAEARPFAIQLEVEFLDRLSEPVRQGKAKSVSEIIRAALSRFDLSKVVVVHSPHVLISVRLPGPTREGLQAAAKAKHTSVGQLVRAAVESYLPQLESGDSDQLEMPIPHVGMPEEPAAPVAAESVRSTSPAAKKKLPARKKPAAKAKPAKAPARKKSKRATKPAPAPKRSARKSALKRAKR